jgi:hypothetical protein
MPSYKADHFHKGVFIVHLIGYFLTVLLDHLPFPFQAAQRRRGAIE